jgi:hypothetical protein
MKRLMLAGAAMMMMATAAHAGSKPTLPKEFQGRWCYLETTEEGSGMRGDSYVRSSSPCPSSTLDVQSIGFTGQYGYRSEGPRIGCKLLVASPYGHDSNAYRTTFKCSSNIDPIQNYWIGTERGRLFMTRETDALNLDKWPTE